MDSRAVNQVKGITFKVKSLDRVNQYFLQNRLFDSSAEGRTKLDQAQTFGLLIYLSGEN